ncbi:MAG: LPS assembly lipoprotein LptE [SAR324 cluster bacterium]|nr:LPS assembly lipoprotein LptE [SAR324 cluster bacterium]
MYVKQRMLSMDYKAVNPLTKVFLLCLALLFSACGFQLNRNQISLPNGATSLSLKKIKNKSFTPGLDIELTRKIKQSLNQSNVKVNSRGELTFSVNITGATKKKTQLEIGTNLTYLYLFSIKSEISLVDNRDHSTIFSKEEALGEYTLETTEDSLDDAAKDQAMGKAVDDLTKKILTKLTQNF